MVRSSREAELLNGVFQELLGVLFQYTVFADLGRAHLGVAEDGVLAEVKASKLKVSCFGHASGNELGGFSTGIPGEFSVAHFGDVDMQIDSVQQGT